MRVGIVWQPIAADHRQPVRHYFLDVVLLHLEVDRTRGQQAFCGVFFGGVPTACNIGQQFTSHFGVRDRPGELYLHVGTQPERHQYGGAGGVRVDVEIHFLPERRTIDGRQGLGAAAEILGHRAFMVADDDGGAGVSADLQRFLDRQHDVVGFVAHVGDVDAAGVAQGFRDGDDLLRRGHAVGWVIQAGGKARGAFCQCCCQALAHVFRFFIGRGALGVVVHRLHP